MRYLELEVGQEVHSSGNLAKYAKTTNCFQRVFIEMVNKNYL